MKQTFNQVGVSPTQSRAAFANEAKAGDEKTLLEREALVPTLKPFGMGEDAVDRQHFQKKMKNEEQRMQRYQQRVVALYTRTYLNGELVNETVEREVNSINKTRQTTDDFNIHACQAWDVYQQEKLGLSF